MNTAPTKSIPRIIPEDRCRLMNAAPRLLGALEDLVAEIERTRVYVSPDVMDSVRVFAKPAIQAAKGEI